ncbi:MAG: four helix bundle protein [Candidatus Yanofskybacteria bacterium]|nr:four helix bundle protein [Candidatus Yanofskybacteria bacterium]
MVYKIWHGYFIRLEKVNRYAIGLKIDNLFIETIEHLFIAAHKNREQKGFYLTKASDLLDMLKFILQISWEIEILDAKKYIALSNPLNEVGKMLGGWQKQTKTPQRSF